MFWSLLCSVLIVTLMRVELLARRVYMINMLRTSPTALQQQEGRHDTTTAPPDGVVDCASDAINNGKRVAAEL